MQNIAMDWEFVWTKEKRQKWRRSECSMEEVQRQLLLQENSEALFAPSVTSVSGVGLLCLI